MNGRYFRENIYEKIGFVSPSKSYAYIPIPHQQEDLSPSYSQQYYPINLILSKEAIHFYQSNFLTDTTDNEFNYYQSNKFLSLPLKNTTDLDNIVRQLGDVPFKDNKENIFVRSKDLTFNLLGQQEKTDSDFLSRLLPKPVKDKELLQDKKYYYKVLFLNFLSDFFYSNTFNTHPDYNAIRKTLEENKTIQAILAKGNYKYCLVKNKELAQSSECLPKTQKRWNDELHSATKRWHQLIIDDAYKDIITIENKWFLDKESEHTEVKRNKHTPLVFSTEELVSSVNWLNNRYNLFSAFQLQHSFTRRKDVVKTKKTNRNRYFFSYGIAALFLLIFGALCLDTSSIFNFIIQEWSGKALITHLSCLALFIISTCILIFNRRKLLEYRPANKPNYFLNKTNFHFKYIVLISLGIFSLLFLFTDFYCELLIFSLFLGLVITFLFLSTLFERIFLTLYYLLSSAEETTKTILTIPSFLGIFRPRILVASASVWLAIYSFPQLWNIDFSIGILHKLFLLLLTGVLFAFVFSKLNSFVKAANKSVSFYRLLFRSSFLILLGLVYSVWLGIGATTNVVKNTFVKEAYYKDFFQELDDSSKLIVRLDTAHYSETKELLIGSQVDSNTSQIDKIESYTRPKPNVNKVILKKYLTQLKKTEDKDDARKAIYYFKVKNPEYWNVNEAAPPLFEAYIIPEFLIFYSFIALAIGIFIEMFFKKKE
jgi:hypothetical protein